MAACGWFVFSFVLEFTPCCEPMAIAFGALPTPHQQRCITVEHQQGAPASAPHCIFQQGLIKGSFIRSAISPSAPGNSPSALIPSVAYAFSTKAAGYIGLWSKRRDPPQRVQAYLLNARFRL